MSGDRYFIRDQNAIYFITPTVIKWLDVFTRLNHREVIVESLNFCVDKKGLNVHAWCLMSSHLHLIASARESFALSDILRDFKKFTADTIITQIKEEPESRREMLLTEFENAGLSDKRITKYKFWQESNHAIELDSWKPEIIDQKLNYIHYNPVEVGLVSRPEDYLYSSARDYAGENGLVKVVLI